MSFAIPIYSVEIGDKFNFIAASNPTTGYVWNYKIDPENKCPGSIKLASESYTRSMPKNNHGRNLVGGGGY